MYYHPVTLQLNGLVAIVKLNRPNYGNAIDDTLAEALATAALTCRETASIRCVLLTGSGSFFCVGGDIVAMRESGTQVSGLIREIAKHLHTAIKHLAGMDKPLITAVNGAAAGAGIGLAVLGDIVLASEAAHFTLGYTRLGLSPDAGASWLLPRLIGLRRSQELILTNRRVSVADALAMGLITRQMESNALIDEATKLAQQLAEGPTRAFGECKRLLAVGFDQDLAMHLGDEGATITRLSATPYAIEGIEAFIDKRAPRFD